MWMRDYHSAGLEQEGTRGWEMGWERAEPGLLSGGTEADSSSP